VIPPGTSKPVGYAPTGKGSPPQAPRYSEEATRLLGGGDRMPGGQRTKYNSSVNQAKYPMEHEYGQPSRSPDLRRQTQFQWGHQSPHVAAPHQQVLYQQTEMDL
jgi:hypothetical protein